MGFEHGTPQAVMLAFRPQRLKVLGQNFSPLAQNQLGKILAYIRVKFSLPLTSLKLVSSLCTYFPLMMCWNLVDLA